jgi:hypothetical protein
MEKFGTAPVSDCYFHVIEGQEDQFIRDLMFATSVTVEDEGVIEDWECIAIEVTDDGIRTSRGWKEFFKGET